jgi:hypothetical protein
LRPVREVDSRDSHPLCQSHRQPPNAIEQPAPVQRPVTKRGRHRRDLLTPVSGCNCFPVQGVGESLGGRLSWPGGRRTTRPDARFRSGRDATRAPLTRGFRERGYTVRKCRQTEANPQGPLASGSELP